MTFPKKISIIENLLGESVHFRDRTLLACAIYLKLKTEISFRKIPLRGIPFTWYNLRYWLQKLKRDGKLPTIQRIVCE